MAEMNDLLNEAAASSTELAARALGAATAAQDVMDQAQALSATAAREAQRLHEHYAQAIAAIEHAAEHTGQAAAAAVQSMVDMGPDAVHATAAVKDMLEAAEAGIIHLGE